MNYDIVGSDVFPRKSRYQRGRCSRRRFGLKACKERKRSDQLLWRAALPQRAEVQRFFPLAQPPSVRRKQQRNVIVCRCWKPKCLLQPHLTRHGAQQIAPPDDLCDAACRVIGHDCELIGAYAVRAADNKIAAVPRKIFGVRALKTVLYRYGGIWYDHTPRGRSGFRRALCLCQAPAGSSIDHIAV